MGQGHKSGHREVYLFFWGGDRCSKLCVLLPPGWPERQSSMQGEKERKLWASTRWASVKLTQGASCCKDEEVPSFSCFLSHWQQRVTVWMYHKLPKDWELIGSAPVLKRQGECVMLSFVFHCWKRVQTLIWPQYAFPKLYDFLSLAKNRQIHGCLCVHFEGKQNITTNSGYRRDHHLFEYCNKEH